MWIKINWFDNISKSMFVSQNKIYENKKSDHEKVKIKSRTHVKYTVSESEITKHNIFMRI
jgi:hypothetical protein